MSHIDEPNSGVISRYHDCVVVQELYPSNFPAACELASAVPAMYYLKQGELPSITHQ